MNKLSTQLLPVFFLAFLFVTGCAEKEVTFKISKKDLQDKIKGGWAGQVIGVTYGGPTEFRFNGRIIPEDHKIPWDDNQCKHWYKNGPGLYDDIYMDLTFVEVFEREGFDAPSESHAKAFANAEYMLWHANQSARYNVLNGLLPPESGHWLNNPHADDIDYQIESDFAGLMSPGMVNVASDISDKIGHIMNYGDGWYGGVYVGAMYALAFISDDINFIVNEALKSIPAKSTFYQCINDVINWHAEYPNDWEKTWYKCQVKWSADYGCPNGVFNDFNIDAKINAAYIVIGLLYGEGDFGKTIVISTRCGQDSDCNPSNAAGILGTVLGYENIPEYWISPVYPVEDMDFKYTTMSLNDIYNIGYKHALAMLENNGINTKKEVIEIPVMPILPVRFEKSFEGHYPKERIQVKKEIGRGENEVSVEFEGNGFVLSGYAKKLNKENKEDYIFELEMEVDGQNTELLIIPTSYQSRRNEIAWKYQLTEGKHNLKIKLLNPKDGYGINISDLLCYTSDTAQCGYKTVK